MSGGRPEGWHRLHPLSPVVRGGRATIAVAILLIPVALGTPIFMLLVRWGARRRQAA